MPFQNEPHVEAFFFTQLHNILPDSRVDNIWHALKNTRNLHSDLNSQVMDYTGLQRCP